MSNLEPHPSLPARPPASSYSAPPRHNISPGVGAYPSAAPAFGGFMPRSVASRAPSMHAPTASAHPMMTSQGPYHAGGYQPNLHPTSNAYYPHQQPMYGTSTPPVVANPYPVPGAAARGYGRMGAYDPEEEARIAEWNSAYTPKEDASKKGENANTVPLGSRSRDGSVAADSGAGSTDQGKTKQKTVIRHGGGKTWEDPSLLEWNPLHPRLFVGNLAGEVTDDSLLKAFSKYPSVSKARVIRDKKTTKSKSYGFVSFANTDDFFRAAREMEGKYIGSHPVRIKRANTEIAATTKKDDKHGKQGKNNNKNKAAAGATTVISGGPTYNAGIQKTSHKKGGPRLLG
ncbi:RNA-binding domain-containing protein [Westerdykella ornata]|uniref:RNA-binding domain-containing protein n=1 Tax=Westerdykella ornata TaxID=318751 RepID=A0A6A6J6V9_WESOR|nr:RNA-binding domain-containing protein [Westerdykella ornata]KAF2272135.1 RNA-binding domain-containing protein [Westerdykella ornata]